MYLLTDSEEDERAVTVKETNIFNELKSMIFETNEDENSVVQMFDIGEQNNGKFH